ncbi:hypothetical protein HMPREF9946_04266 [Acetobacteraceae bacterium AT-5844]|nr:hypothetical protein HMPREF9946_04266 [Acetobacteraceae bacterium AT-5844]
MTGHDPRQPSPSDVSDVERATEYRMTRRPGQRSINRRSAGRQQAA